jgi:DNA-binding transcriptional MerR regulator
LANIWISASIAELEVKESLRVANAGESSAEAVDTAAVAALQQEHAQVRKQIKNLQEQVSTYPDTIVYQINKYEQQCLQSSSIEERGIDT